MHALVATLGSDWTNLMGPFQVVLLHYPLGILTCAVLLEAWAYRRPSEPARQAVGFTLGLGAVVAWLVVGLGLLRAVQEGLDPQLLQLHKVFGIAVAALSTLCWWLHRQLCPAPERRFVRSSYRSLLGLGFILLILTGSRGGSPTENRRFRAEGKAPSGASLLTVVAATPGQSEVMPTTADLPAETSGREARRLNPRPR